MYPRVSKADRCLREEYRSILATIVRQDRSARIAFQHLLRLGANRIRPDYKLVRNASGTYDRLDDFEAWYAYIPAFGGMSICMLRHRDGKWEVFS